MVAHSDYVICSIANSGSWRNLLCSVQRVPDSSVCLHVKQGSFVGYSEDDRKS